MTPRALTKDHFVTASSEADRLNPRAGLTDIDEPQLRIRTPSHQRNRSGSPATSIHTMPSGESANARTDGPVPGAPGVLDEERQRRIRHRLGDTDHLP